jgi:arginine N-succinyltransferase
MSFRIRPAKAGDVDAIVEMAVLTGGGFTNLPADKDTIARKVARSQKAFSRESEEQSDDLFLFVLENPAEKLIRGTCQIFGKVGVTQAFYSYAMSTLTQWSPELGKTFHNRQLSLTTDLEGSSEVGGLFLHPDLRSGGWGTVLARSRYLFIKQHRARFGDRTLAELRGVIEDGGHSPFWDALAGRFFDMSFPEADHFNATHGTQFIADLMPKTPIYVDLLDEKARAVIGQPHPAGKAAMRMLEEEGFSYDRYIDIFDGGPTVTAPTDRIRTVREAMPGTVSAIADGGSTRALLAAGRLGDFRACRGAIARDGGKLTIDPQSAALLEVEAGDEVLAVEQ